MSKIFGDKYKEEIRSLKKLDRSLLKCKADIERVIHYIESKKSFTNINVKLRNISFNYNKNLNLTLK